ncbi:YciI family protein [Methylocapsa sp. S129]|uniref:YciI family protein n=1 Tax=Methylocapsa sp. S129 TaxID=1641869 RepID=UPI00131CA2B1|nr:YciI family protein [Methylocapsa sp. S129]
MKYLCLVYFEPHVFSTLSDSDKAALDRDSLNYDKELEKNGHYILAAALQSVATATTVRMRGGKISMTDGPFAETREVLGGFIFIEARDLNEALRIAGNIPMARYGSIEVRPELNIG